MNSQDELWFCYGTTTMRRQVHASLAAFTLLSSLTALSAVEPIDIGSRRELFVDRLLVDRMEHVELRLHHPLKATRPKSPLPVAHYITVIKDKDERGDLFRAYWRGSDPSYSGNANSGNSGEVVRYAESRDGHEPRLSAEGHEDHGGIGG